MSLPAAAPMDDNGLRLTDEQRRRRRGRSVALALVLAALAALFYIVTIIQMAPGG